MTVPDRLKPYLTDLLATGLYGDSLDEVIVTCVRLQIRQAIKVSAIPQRAYGAVDHYAQRQRRAPSGAA